MSSDLVPLDLLGREIRARIEAGDKSAAKAEDHYIAAGQQLDEARKRIESDGGSFRSFLSEHQIGKSRAYDILAVVHGRKTFAGIKAKAAERAARHADRGRTARLSVTNGQSAWMTAKGSPFAPVEVNLPDDLCARAWARQLSQLQPKGADEWSYHGLCHAFAKLSPRFRMRVMVDWFNSMPLPDQLEFHESCPSPAMPEYMGDWLVEALLSNVSYRPPDMATDEGKECVAFAEMDEAIKTSRSWPEEKRDRYDARNSDVPDCVPAFLRRAA